jgi:predicted metal-dependent phosphoesterase TrpH
MIDLHMHTTCSDGTDSVEKLVDNVIEAGITCFSITDHDTAKACRKILKSEELKQKIHNAGVTFVPGIEFSCIYNGRKCALINSNFSLYCFVRIF